MSLTLSVLYRTPFLGRCGFNVTIGIVNGFDTDYNYEWSIDNGDWYYTFERVAGDLIGAQYVDSWFSYPGSYTVSCRQVTGVQNKPTGVSGKVAVVIPDYPACVPCLGN